MQYVNMTKIFNNAEYLSEDYARLPERFVSLTIKG